MNKEAIELISIIIPVYNREDCISRTIDSILNQSFPGFKIYIIDDCSTDKTWDILKSYSLLDERINVFRLEHNSGPSFARNYALDRINGQWVSFIDSDDYIAKDYLENLILKTDGAVDMVISSFVSVSNDGETIKKYTATSYYEASTSDIALEISYSREADLDFVYNLCCNKLYRKRLFDGVRFPVGRLQEDAYVMPFLLYNCNNKIVCAPEAVYYYVDNSDSISHMAQEGIHDLKRRCDLLFMYEHHIKLFKDRGNQLYHRTRLNYLNNAISMFKLHYTTFHTSYPVVFKKVRFQFGHVLRDCVIDKNPLMNWKMYTVFFLFHISPKLYLSIFK